MKHFFNYDKNRIYVRGEAIGWNDVYPNALKGKKTVEMFSRQIAARKDHAFVIDCNRLTEIDINFLRQLKEEAVRHDYTKDFIFIRNEISELEEMLREAGFDVVNANGCGVIANAGDSFEHKKSEIPEIVNSYERFLEKRVKSIIESTFTLNHPGDQSRFEKLASTPLLANGEFDAGAILSDPASFLMVVTYLADKLEIFLQREKLKKQNSTKFLAVNLRSSPLVSAVAKMLGFDFLIIDHLGPNHKRYNVDFGQKHFSTCAYVYIGDFLVGGTEVGIAQNYVQFLGGRLEHAFVLGSYFKPEENRFDGKFAYEHLVCLKGLRGFKVKFNDED